MAAPDKKTRNTFIALALLAALAGVVIGALLVRQWSPENSAGSAPTARMDPEVSASLRDMAKELGEMREEQNSTRLQVADLYQRLAPADDSGLSDAALRAALPPPYVKQVDDFFESAAARSLLSAKAQTRPSIKFGRPVFVSSSVITVPYTISGKQQYIMVGVKILDYYDLQFDVLWDSVEGEKP
jgi:hypothetical protein